MAKREPTPTTAKGKPQCRPDKADGKAKKSCPDVKWDKIEKHQPPDGAKVLTTCPPGPIACTFFELREETQQGYVVRGYVNAYGTDGEHWWMRDLYPSMTGDGNLDKLPPPVDGLSPYEVEAYWESEMGESPGLEADLCEAISGESFHKWVHGTMTSLTSCTKPSLAPQGQPTPTPEAATTESSQPDKAGEIDTGTWHIQQPDGNGVLQTVGWVRAYTSGNARKEDWWVNTSVTSAPLSGPFFLNHYSSNPGLGDTTPCLAETNPVPAGTYVGWRTTVTPPEATVDCP